MTENTTTTETGAQGSTTGTLADVVAQDKPDAKPGAQAEGNGAEGTNPAWTSQLPEEMRRDAELMGKVSKHQKIGDLAKAYAALEGKDVIPGKDADAETREAFYRKLGKPENAEGYGFDSKAAAFAQIAYDNNLSKEQAKNVMAGITKIAEAEAEAARNRQEALLKSTDEALHKQYGGKYSEAIAHMKRGLVTYGGEKLGQVLQQAGLIYHPEIVKLFIQLGEQSSEASSTSRSAGGGSDKYVPTSQGGTFHFKDL